VLVEHWRQSRQEQLHLVNYADQPQRVTVTFGRTVSGQALSPDGPQAAFEGVQLELRLDVYTLLLYS
jgi:hypothetical protein